MFATRKITIYFCTNLLILSLSIKAFSCTIFYIKNDTIILAGNNEDWEDPYSRMWFYPSENGKYGWIKFGWGSGFPQGGMNDQGVFWDATSGPYLEMPYSEQNKEKYPGPLMQKIIEECESTEDAISVFSRLYCEDQYRAQYLVGDSKFNSMIVEGDSIISMDGDYLILTNFYHSNPSLGGYPCWRYDKASEMITNTENYTKYLVGSILSETHQEGRYPTQYSQIYDLINCQIYLFHHHNYEEFIVIDLVEELKKGYRSFDIPDLFANIKLGSPYEDEKISSTKVEFSWEGKPGFRYELIYATNPDFNESTSEYITSEYPPVHNHKIAIFAMAGLLCMLPVTKGRLRRKRILILSLFMVLNLHCEKDKNAVEEDKLITMTKTVDNLLPNTPYYWKIKSSPIDHNDFQSETITRYFITERSGN